MRGDCGQECDSNRGSVIFSSNSGRLLGKAGRSDRTELEKDTQSLWRADQQIEWANTETETETENLFLSWS